MATQDTSALNPEFLALYNAQLPQVLLAAQQQAQAKGLFNSGNAADAATKAQADLMASLLAQQQAQVQQTSINQANINQANNAQSNEIASNQRIANQGLIGTAAGSALTLGGLGLINKLKTGSWLGSNPQNIINNGGNSYSYDPVTGKATQIDLPGQPSVGGPTLAPPADINTPGAMSTLPGVPANPNGGALDGLSPAPGGAWNAPGGANGMGGINPQASITPGLGDASLAGTVPSTGAADVTNLFAGGGAPDFSSMVPDMSSMAAGAGDAASGAAGGFADMMTAAKGGIFNKPTIAQIGDAGPGNPEEVIPLSKLQGAVGPAGAAAVMNAVPNQPGAPMQPGGAPPQPGMSPGVAAPPPPGMPPAPLPSMWSQPSAGGPVPPPAPISPRAALHSGGLLGNLFNRPRPA